MKLDRFFRSSECRLWSELLSSHKCFSWLFGPKFIDMQSSSAKQLASHPASDVTHTLFITWPIRLWLWVAGLNWITRQSSKDDFSSTTERKYLLLFDINKFIFCKLQLFRPLLKEYIKYQQVHSNKSISGAGSPSCRPGSGQLNLQKNMNRQTDSYGKAMKKKTKE